MKNEKLIAGLNEVANGIKSIIEALELENGSTSAPAPKTTEKSKSETKRLSAQTDAEPEEVIKGSGCPYSEEELRAMKFNALKKEAAGLGVDCKGTRDDIIGRLLELGTVEESEDQEPAEEPKESAPAVKKTGLKKKEEPKEDGISPEFMETASKLVAENDIEDIIAELERVGIKCKSKKADKVIPLLAEALQKELISLEDESEEEQESDPEFEITPETWFSEFDVTGVNNPDNMTEERKEATEAEMQEIIDGIETGEISDKDIHTFIDTFANEAETDVLGDNYNDEELISLYCEMRKHMIGDDGTVNEPKSPYEVKEEYFCCGHQLGYDGKKKKFICETCGESYDAE